MLQYTLCPKTLVSLHDHECGETDQRFETESSIGTYCLPETHSPPLEAHGFQSASLSPEYRVDLNMISYSVLPQRCFTLNSSSCFTRVMHILGSSVHFSTTNIKMTSLSIRRRWHFDAAVHTPPGRNIRVPRKWQSKPPSRWIAEIDVNTGRRYLWDVITRERKWCTQWDATLQDLKQHPRFQHANLRSSQPIKNTDYERLIGVSSLANPRSS